MTRRILHSGLAVVLAIALFASNIPFGALEFAAARWNERNVVDVAWLAEHDTDVVDSLRPGTASAAEVTLDTSVNTTGTAHVKFSSQTVFTSDQTGYKFYRDSSGECVYRKTTDGGSTWGSPVLVDDQGTGTDCVHIAVWYDRWTPGDTGDTIHIITMDTGTDDLWYNAVDTADADARLTGSTAINTTSNSSYAGTLTAAANHMTIAKGTDGTLYAAVTDASDSTVVTCSASCGTASNWSEAGTNPMELAAETQILMPLPGGDMLLILNDTSASDIESKEWNGTAWDGSWTALDTNATDNTTYDQNMAATIDPSTGDIYLAYLADISTAGTNDDIRTAIYSGGSWTSTGDVVTDSACAGGSDCAPTSVAIALDEGTGDVYVAYAAAPSSATITTQNVYWKKSTDGMATWGSEQGPVNASTDDIYGVDLNSVSDERIFVTYDMQTPNDLYGDTLADLTPSAPATAPTAVTRFATGVTAGTATLNGSVASTGGEDATEHGFAYSTDPSLAAGVSTTTLGAYSGTGLFSDSVDSLSSDQTYYFRAYATNSGGTGYGGIETFFTGDSPASRRLRLFGGFLIKLVSGKFIVN